MVGVAQLVELLVVVQVAAGSSPVTHPFRSRAVPSQGAQPDVVPESTRPALALALSAHASPLDLAPPRCAAQP